MSDILQEFQKRIVEANTRHLSLQIRGAGTKDWYGQSGQGEILDTRGYSGIIDYEPTELVITARCGTPLSEIDAALAQHSQMLAFEPPRFGGVATVGGMVAAGLSGPGRQSSGAVRDFVLGVDMMNAQGQVLHFGGQVMKNVAGYDVSRLLTGSLGTLGLILQVSLKLLPQPFATSTRVFEWDQENAIRMLNEWGGQPLPISASVWHNGVLTIRLSGAQAAVDAAEKKLGGTILPDSDRFWSSLREQTQVFFDASDVPLWRISVPSTTPAMALHGTPLIEWGGAQRWYRGEYNYIQLRELAQSVGGHATLYRGGDKNVGVFQPLAPAVANIHRRLKKEFDPHAIFNPGRMYPEM